MISMIGSKLPKLKTAFYESHLRHCELSWKKNSQAIYKFNNPKGLIVEFLIVLGKDKLV